MALAIDSTTRVERSFASSTRCRAVTRGVTSKSAPIVPKARPFSSRMGESLSSAQKRSPLFFFA